MSRAVLERPPGPPAIDERIRARRIQVRRSEGRRRLRRLLVLVVVTCLALAGWGATRSPLLDVDEVVVRGAARTGRDVVADVAAIAQGDALVDVDLAAAADRVGALPWIAEAEVARSWTGTITVDVVERTPVAVLVGDDGSAWLVDRDGVVLADASSTDVVAGHVVVEGLAPPAPGERTDDAPPGVLDLAQALDGDLRAATAAIVVADEEVWIRLHPRPGEVDAEGASRTDGGRVRFGDLRRVDEQVLAASTVVAQVELADLDVVDVRVPSHPVVTRIDTADGEVDE